MTEAKRFASIRDSMDEIQIVDTTLRDGDISLWAYGMRKEHLFAGIFLLSFSVLIFEITLIRWLSVVVPSNLAFLGITFALFGVAFGGVIVYGIPGHFTLEKFNKQLSRYSLSYGIVLSIFIIIFSRLNFSVGGVVLVAMYVLPAIPFTLANICLSLLFKFRSDLMSGLYFLDLAGASFGILAAIVLLNQLNAANLFFIAGALGLMAAWLESFTLRSRSMIWKKPPSFTKKVLASWRWKPAR